MQSAPRAEAPHPLIHVAYSNGRWRVIESGERNAISNFGERRDAMEYATGLAARLRASLVIHKGHLDNHGPQAVEDPAGEEAANEGPGVEAPGSEPTARS